MIICLDTNVLIALFSGEPGAAELAGQLYGFGLALVDDLGEYAEV